MLAREVVFVDSTKDCVGYIVVVELDYSTAVDSSLSKKKNIRFSAVEKISKTIIVVVSEEFGFINYLYL